MAPLTWRNVDAPTFAGVTESQRLMGQLMNNGFSALDRALSDFQGARRDRASTQLIADASRYTDPDALDAALRSGTLLDGINPRLINADALNFVTGRTRDLLGNESSRASTEGQRLSNDWRGITNDQLVWDNNRIREFEANRPAAMQAIAEIRSLADSGTPEGLDRARSLMQQNMGIFSAAGWTPEDVTRMMSGNNAAARDALSLDQTFIETGDTRIARERSLQGEQIASAALRQYGGPAAAARAIRSMDAHPDVISAALGIIEGEQGAQIFGQPANETQVMLDQALQEAGQAPGNPLVNLIDRHEGGGDYSTLYGHAQRPGEALAGVDVSRMTIGELADFASSDGAYGRHQKQQLGYLATPMGRFQIVGSTLQATAKEMGLSPDTVFTPEIQNAMFNHLVDKRISGPRSMEGKIAGLRQEWEGFKNVPDQVLAEAITAYENGDRAALGGAISGTAGMADQTRSTMPATSANPANSIIAQAATPATGPSLNDLTGLQGQFTDVRGQGQSLVDTITADSGFDVNASLVEELVTRPNRGTHKADVVQTLYDSIGDEDGLTLDQLTDEVNYVVNKHNVAPDIAAAFIKNAVEETGWWEVFSGDREVARDQIDQMISEFIDPETDQLRPERLQDALAQMEAIRTQETITAEMAQIQSQVEAARQEYLNAVRRAQMGFPVDTEAARLRYEALLGAAEQLISARNSNPLVRANTSALTRR